LGTVSTAEVYNQITCIYDFSHSEFEAVFHSSVGVVHCGGFEVHNMKTAPLKLLSASELNFKLQTVKFLRHINPEVQVSQID
jgi:hypothetical protein